MEGGDVGAVTPILEWSLALSNYPIQLGASLALAVGLIWGLRANPVSVFAFAFSAWFAILWTLIVARLFLEIPWERHDAHTLGVVVLAAAIWSLFAVPAGLALRSLRLHFAAEDQGGRAVQYAGALLFAHAGNVLFMLVLASMR